MTVHRDKFLIIKTTTCTNVSNLFWKEILHVSDSSSVHHQGLWQLVSRSKCSCSQAVSKHIWHTPLLCVQWKNSWWWTEELSETCRISFQNKFEKLVHLEGFIITNMTTLFRSAQTIIRPILQKLWKWGNIQCSYNSHFGIPHVLQ